MIHIAHGVENEQTRRVAEERKKEIRACYCEIFGTSNLAEVRVEDLLQAL